MYVTREVRRLQGSPRTHTPKPGGLGVPPIEESIGGSYGSYMALSLTDPVNRKGHEFFVARGGSYFDPPVRLRLADRGMHRLPGATPGVGCRLVAVPIRRR